MYSMYEYEMCMLQGLGGLRLTDAFLKRPIEFDEDLAQVIVHT